MSKSRPPIAEVVWLDALTTPIGECHTIKSAKEYELVARHSTGYLLLKNNKKVVISAIWEPGEDDDEAVSVSEVTVIPSPWLVSFTIVQKARTIKPKPKKK